MLTENSQDVSSGPESTKTILDNGWNYVGISGFGCIKIIDCTRYHFDGDILRAKSLFSTRWKIGKLSRMELNEKFLAKWLALSVDIARTSGPLKRGGTVYFPLLGTLLQILHTSTKSDKLRCNRATSCFAIIGPCIFEDFLTEIMRITK